MSTLPPPGAPMIAPPPRSRSRAAKFAVVAAPVLVLVLGTASVAIFVPEPSVTGNALPGPTPTTTTTIEPIEPPLIDDPDEDTKVVVAKDGKSQITVPQSWTQFPKFMRTKGVEIEQGNPLREQYVIVVTDSKQDFVDFDAYVDVVRDLATEMDDFRVIRTQKLRLDGLPAVRVQYSATIEGVKVIYWDTAVRGKKAFYEVIGWTLRSQRTESGPGIVRVLNSFRETTRGGD
jgi:hypothetical protein